MPKPLPGTWKIIKNLRPGFDRDSRMGSNFTIYGREEVEIRPENRKSYKESRESTSLAEDKPK